MLLVSSAVLVLPEAIALCIGVGCLPSMAFADTPTSGRCLTYDLACSASSRAPLTRPGARFCRAERARSAWAQRAGWLAEQPGPGTDATPPRWLSAVLGAPAAREQVAAPRAAPRAGGRGPANPLACRRGLGVGQRAAPRRRHGVRAAACAGAAGCALHLQFFGLAATISGGQFAIFV